MKRLSLIFLTLSLNGCQCARNIAKAVGLCKADAPIIPPVIDPQTMIINRIWWLIPLAILGAGAGVFLAVSGKIKTGLACVIACGATLALSVTVFQHFKLIAWIGVGVSLAALAYALWIAYAHRRAIAELVETTEAAKEELEIMPRAEIFGGEDDHGKAGKIQSSTTEKIVSAVRKALGLK